MSFFCLTGRLNWKEKTLSAKLNLIKPCNVVLKRLKLQTDNIVPHCERTTENESVRTSAARRKARTTCPLARLPKTRPDSRATSSPSSLRTVDEATAEEDDINVQGLDHDRQEVINMQADALAEHSRESKANREAKVIMSLLI
jgi:hypothetical protein